MLSVLCLANESLAAAAVIAPLASTYHQAEGIIDVIKCERHTNEGCMAVCMLLMVR